MTSRRSRPRRFAIPLAVVVAVVAPAQDPARPRVNREAMWFAPTAEDWQKPCLVKWQRSFDDALVVSRETGKPILVCVNMDGEIASEHYAGVRYRQPEIAKLYEPYVTVIASVYRHNPRDYDEAGHRILCPRFGSVTCGEHIAIEPGLYDKYFEGQRVAPRHIGVELDNAEMFDVFYAWDTDTIFQALRKGIADRPAPSWNPSRGDRPLLERVSSRDLDDRTAVEAAYVAGDRAVRRSLLVAAATSEPLPVDLLRLAIRGLDVELNRLARQVLAERAGEHAIDLVLDALRMPMEAGERQALIAALARLGETSPRARNLALVHRGLGATSTTVDVAAWSTALAATDVVPTRAESAAATESRLEASAAVAAQKPGDAAARVDLAEATLRYAFDVRTDAKHKRALFEDARRIATEAEQLGATGWRVNAAIAIAAWHSGDVAAAHQRAEAAVRDIPAAARDWTAAAVLAMFAQARQQAVAAAVRDKAPWPPEWLADANAAYAVLARHPLGTDLQVATQIDFLTQLGAAGQAAQVLQAGLSRFPASWALHERLRNHVLADRGLAGLEATYDEMLRAVDAAPTLQWFAGYASLVTAEFHKQAGRDDEALAAYDRAIAHYERGVAGAPDTRATADHYIALANAGRARIALERGDHAGAVDQLLAALSRKPEAAATEDGLGRSPVATARLLIAELKARGQDASAAAVDAALQRLDPELLQLPLSERMPSRRGAGARRRPGSGG